MEVQPFPGPATASVQVPGATNGMVLVRVGQVVSVQLLLDVAALGEQLAVPTLVLLAVQIVATKEGAVAGTGVHDATAVSAETMALQVVVVNPFAPVGPEVVQADTGTSVVVIGVQMVVT